MDAFELGRSSKGIAMRQVPLRVLARATTDAERHCLLRLAHPTLHPATRAIRVIATTGVRFVRPAAHSPCLVPGVVRRAPGR